MRKRILVVSDLHIPFQDDGAVRKAMEIGKRFTPDTVVLNGDIVDFAAISKFVKSPKERDLKKELDMTNKFLKMVRQKFPLAKLIYKSGNHEERLLVYLWTKAEAFADLPELTLPSLLHFKENRIEYSPKENVLKFGDLSVVHGHEIKGTLSTYPARTGYQSAKTNVLFGGGGGAVAAPMNQAIHPPPIATKKASINGPTTATPSHSGTSQSLATQVNAMIVRITHIINNQFEILFVHFHKRAAREGIARLKVEWASLRVYSRFGAPFQLSGMCSVLTEPSENRRG